MEDDLRIIDLEEQVRIEQDRKKAVSEDARRKYHSGFYLKRKQKEMAANNSGKRKADGVPVSAFATPVGQAIGTTTEATLVQSAMKILEAKTSSFAMSSTLNETYMAGLETGAKVNETCAKVNETYMADLKSAKEEQDAKAAKLDDDTDAIFALIRSTATGTAIAVPMMSAGPTPSTSRGSSRSSSPVQVGQGRMLFQTPAKTAGLMGTLSPVDSVGSKENEDVKMPAITPIRYVLMVGSLFGSEAAEIFAATSTSTELSDLFLAKKPVKVTQISDCPVVLFEDGTVVAVVDGSKPGHLWGTTVKPKQEIRHLVFDGFVQSIDACGNTLLASLRGEGEYRVCRYQGGGAFTAPFGIATGTDTLAFLGPDKLYGYVTKELEDKCNHAAMRVVTLDGDTSTTTTVAGLHLPKCRRLVTLVSGSDAAYHLAADGDKFALHFRKIHPKSSMWELPKSRKFCSGAVAGLATNASQAYVVTKGNAITKGGELCYATAVDEWLALSDDGFPSLSPKIAAGGSFALAFVAGDPNSLLSLHAKDTDPKLSWCKFDLREVVGRSILEVVDVDASSDSFGCILVKIDVDSETMIKTKTIGVSAVGKTPAKIMSKTAKGKTAKSKGKTPATDAPE